MLYWSQGTELSIGNEMGIGIRIGSGNQNQNLCPNRIRESESGSVPESELGSETVSESENWNTPFSHPSTQQTPPRCNKHENKKIARMWGLPERHPPTVAAIEVGILFLFSSFFSILFPSFFHPIFIIFSTTNESHLPRRPTRSQPTSAGCDPFSHVSSCYC